MHSPPSLQIEGDISTVCAMLEQMSGVIEFFLLVFVWPVRCNCWDTIVPERARIPKQAESNSGAQQTESEWLVPL
jgi:hypothetical protein